MMLSANLDQLTQLCACLSMFWRAAKSFLILPRIGRGNGVQPEVDEPYGSGIHSPPLLW